MSKKHLLTPASGTLTGCTCGKVYATMNEAQQHIQNQRFHEYYKPFWEAWDKIEKEELEKDLVREVLEHRRQAKLELIEEIKKQPRVNIKNAELRGLPGTWAYALDEFLDTKQKEVDNAR